MRSPIKGVEIDFYVFKTSTVKPDFVASFSTLVLCQQYQEKHYPNSRWIAVGKQIIAGSR